MNLHWFHKYVKDKYVILEKKERTQKRIGTRKRYMIFLDKAFCTFQNTPIYSTLKKYSNTHIHVFWIRTPQNNYSKTLNYSYEHFIIHRFKTFVMLHYSSMDSEHLAIYDNTTNLNN